jgi:segregation and condensation protein B
MSSGTLVDQLEALLFVTESPATLESLASALRVTVGQVEQGLELLEHRLNERGAIRLIKIAGGYQLCTKEEYAVAVADFLQPQRRTLSRALMEVLAVIVYRQPITIAEIDATRGIASEYGVRSLVERRLIREVGRRPTPGRPVLYGTTQQFLHHFKLNDLKELPPVEIKAKDAE